MSRTCTLSTQTGKLFIIIRKDKKIPMDKIKAYCQTFGEEYAFIEHEKDIDKDTGEIEKVHYHIVMNSQFKEKRLSTHLNDLVNFFGFKNEIGISIEKYVDYAKALQYLTHQNFPEKTPHDKSEIITNIEKSEFDSLMDTNTQVVSFDYVLTICKNSANIIDVIRALGIKRYHKYRATIRDIWDNKY